jgi:hypothetical protein
LKNQSDAVGERRKSRSRLRSESGRLRSASPRRKTAQKAPQIHGSLIAEPPNAPGEPRAIPHATCGPVHASTTAPLESSTVPCAISPAAPHQIFTVHWPVFAEYVSSSTSPCRG